MNYLIPTCYEVVVTSNTVSFLHALCCTILFRVVATTWYLILMATVSSEGLHSSDHGCIMRTGYRTKTWWPLT